MSALLLSMWADIIRRWAVTEQNEGRARRY